MSRAPDEFGWGEPATEAASGADAGDHKYGTLAGEESEDREKNVSFGRTAIWEEGVEDETIEKELYGGPRVGVGSSFFSYGQIKVTARGEDVPPPINSFKEMGLHELLMQNIERMNYSEPTPIQKHSVPIIRMSRDLMACAQTGSGKTAGFLVPIIDKLLKKGEEFYKKAAPRSKGQPICLILSPTRELAIQTYDEARKFCYKSWVKPCPLYGGVDGSVVTENLGKGCDILVATTGRLKSALQNRRISLANVRFFVLDECDRMLDEGFEADIHEIVTMYDMPNDERRQTLLFSATIPKEIRRLAREYVQDIVLLTVGRVSMSVPTSVTQSFIEVSQGEKVQKLLDILYAQEPMQTLIFCNTKRAVDTLDDILYSNKFPVTSIHSDRSQLEREKCMNAFKKGICPIMISTEVAARGLDVASLAHVVNFDMPEDLEQYIHRIGRTARLGNPGYATSFYDASKDAALVPQLIQILKESGQEVPSFFEGRQDDEKVEDEFMEENDLEEGDLPSYVQRDNGNGNSNGGGGERGEETADWGEGGGGNDDPYSGW